MLVLQKSTLHSFWIEDVLWQNVNNNQVVRHFYPEQLSQGHKGDDSWLASVTVEPATLLLKSAYHKAIS